MPTLLEQIDQQMKDAMRARDQGRLGPIRMLKSAIKVREIELNRELTDADVVQVAQTQIKQRKDAAEQYDGAARPELAKKEREEIAVLEGFLPRQLTDDELRGLVQEAIAETGAKSPREMGNVMKAAMARVAGRAEGKRVSEAVKDALARVAT